MLRKIIHIDMDAFFAAVEQRDNPSLQGKCIAVGGSEERGVVATASYEARLYGVKSAMPSVIAKRKCPKLIFIKPRFEVYKEVSNQIRNIFKEYTDLIEPLSLDEAYLDVTSNFLDIDSATEIALQIKEKIKSKTNLTASAGVSYNKFLAKIASDYHKPDGIFVIKPKEAEQFIESLPISKFFGIGKVTAQTMSNMGIKNGLDLKKLSLEKLTTEFGKTGIYYYNIARGIDNRLVNPNQIRKSVGSEKTFLHDISTIKEIKREILPLLDDVWKWCEKNNIFGKTITIKIKYANFKINSKSKTINTPFTKKELLLKFTNQLISSILYEDQSIRLIGISISNLVDFKNLIGKQLELDFKNN